MMAARDYESALAEVSTLTDKTIDQMGEMSNALILQSIQLGQMPIESTRLLYQTISAGATDAADSMLVMQTAQKAAIAGMADQVDVLSLLSSAVKSYGVSWTEVTKISDLAFQTVKLGQTTMAELSRDMQRTLSPAAALKISMEELFGAFATLTGVTGDTAEVATQLRGIMALLIKPGEDAKKAARELGIEWSANAVKARGLGAILRDLGEATGGDVAQIARFIPNVRALTGALALVGPQAEVFTRKTEEMRNSAGASNEAFRKMSQTMKFAQDQFKASRQALAILVGKPLLDAMRPIIQGLNALTIGLVKFAAANPALMKIFTTFVYGASVLMSIAGAVLLLKGAFIILGAVAPLVLGGLKVAFLGLFATALPMLGMIAAFAALVSAFTRGKDSIGGGFVDLWEKGSLIWKGLGELIDTFDGKFGKMSLSTANALKKAGLFTLTVRLFMLWARASAFFEGLKDGFVGATKEMGDTFGWLIGKFGFLKPVVEAIAEAFSGLGLEGEIKNWKDMGKMIGFFGGHALIALGTIKLMLGTWRTITKVWKGAIATKALLTVKIKSMTDTMRIAALYAWDYARAIAAGMKTKALALWTDTLGASFGRLALTGLGLIGVLGILALVLWRNRKELKEFWELNKATDWKQIATEFLGWIFQVDAATTSMEKLKEATKTYLRVLAGITTFGVSELIIRALGKLDELEKKAKMPAPGETVVGLPGAGVAAPKLQKGTPRVKRSGLAFVHKGEAITRSDVAEVLPMRRRIAAPEEAAGMAQPTRETIELIVNLDGDVLARAIAERDRRMGLRQVN
jgi:TP901 family phage tail tape measure protein